MTSFSVSSLSSSPSLVSVGNAMFGIGPRPTHLRIALTVAAAVRHVTGFNPRSVTFARKGNHMHIHTTSKEQGCQLKAQAERRLAGRSLNGTEVYRMARFILMPRDLSRCCRGSG